MDNVDRPADEMGNLVANASTLVEVASTDIRFGDLLSADTHLIRGRVLALENRC